MQLNLRAAIFNRVPLSDKHSMRERLANHQKVKNISRIHELRNNFADWGARSKNTHFTNFCDNYHEMSGYDMAT